RRDALGDLNWVQCGRALVNIGEGRRRSRGADRLRRRDERVWLGENLVARPDTQRAQRQFQRVGAVAHADAVGRLAIGREIRLEGALAWPQEELHALQNVRQFRQYLLADRRVLRLQVDKRDLRADSG